MAQSLTIDEDDKDVAATLAPYIQSGNLNFLIGSGASLPAIKIAGDIEAQLNDLIKGKKDAEADLKMVDFIEAIGNTYDALKDVLYDADLEETFNNYAKFLSLIDLILFSRKNEILPRQASFFSTNYDVFIEFAASACPNVIVNDGFDRTSGDPENFIFSPEKYFDRTYRASTLYARHVEIPTINLVKLHGSLNWARKGRELICNFGSVRKLSAAEKEDPKKIAEYLKKYFLIMPNLRKFHQTLMDRVYYDMLRLFSKAMEQENAVLIAFGFSFNDEHILDITKRSLRNPTSHLIIFSHGQDGIPGFEAKFKKQRNVTVIGPTVGTHIDFPRLNSILTSVLPAVQNG